MCGATGAPQPSLAPEFAVPRPVPSTVPCEPLQAKRSAAAAHNHALRTHVDPLALFHPLFIMSFPAGLAAGGAGGSPNLASPTPVGAQESMINLLPYIDVARSQVLNADPKTQLRSVLSLTAGVLRSDEDVDQELLLVVQFNETVKLRGIRITATESKSDSDADASGPAVMKLFLHRPSYSFADCESEEPTETINLTPEQLKGEQEVKVKFVKFQSVNDLTIFIPSNQDDTPVTFLNKLEFIGTVVGGTNMSELKKIEHDH